MSWRKGCSRTRGPEAPLAPMRLPKAAFEDLFEEIEPLPDGRRRYRFRDPLLKNTAPLTEVRAELIQNEITEIKPMSVPMGLVFYLNYTYSTKDNKT